MNPHDHNPAPRTTVTRSSVIDERDGGGGHRDSKGKRKPVQRCGEKRDEPDLRVKADVFGDDTVSGEPPKITVLPVPRALTPRALEKKPAKCSSETAARGVIEKHRGRALSDKEWTQDRKRLVEFVLILKRWNEAQRGAEAATSGPTMNTSTD